MRKIVITGVTCTLLASCGRTVQSPLATPSEATRMSLGVLCERYVNWPPNNNFHKYAKIELNRRGIKPSECFSVVER